MPEFAGHLHLTAARREDGSTFLAAQSFRAPFHIGKPYWDGRVLQVQVVNPTAGILAGDRLEMDVRVEPGAALCMTTPAATRAFMMRGGAALCEQRFTVAAGSSLEVAPEPLCPHAGTNFVQRTVIDAAPDADVVFADALAPGRAGRGERHAWTNLEISLDVRVSDEPVLRERMRGDGAAMARAAAFHQTPDAWLGNIVVLTTRIAADSPVWARIRKFDTGACRLGVSRLRHGGWVVRVIVASGQELRDVFSGIRRALAEELPFLHTDLRKL